MSENARLKIKLGQVEVEYEGNAEFLKTDLLNTFKEVLKLQNENPLTVVQGNIVQTSTASVLSQGGITHSTDTIANLLKVNTGTDLVIAAAAHLFFAKGQQTFTRQDIINEMKTATLHYKGTYLGNLTGYFTTLKKADRIRLITAPDTYSLSNNEKQSLESSLANS